MDLTVTQRQRLLELSAPEEDLGKAFSNSAERDRFFREKERLLTAKNRDKLLDTLHRTHRPLVLEIEEVLSEWLMNQGFTRVVTPTIITGDMLARMTVTPEHKLSRQVFRLEDGKCLRPMLAPNLYALMGGIRRLTREPVRIFESGSCFRKESRGSRHLNEFTMLNFVELAGVAEGGQMPRLKALAQGAMAVLGIGDYELVTEESEVYGETLDLVVNGEELASGAYGPHVLDGNWGVFDPWVGLGFGLERLAMVKGGYRNISSVARGLSYLDGARLRM